MVMTDNKDITPLVAAFVAKMKSGGATPEQIQQAVDNYLTENPVTAGELSVSNHIISLVGGSSNENP